MKILFFGDVNGEAGIAAVKRDLPKWKKQYKPDLVIANAENSARPGMTPETLDQLLEAGADFFTSGDHFDDKDWRTVLDYPIIRPYNVVGKYPGEGMRIVKTRSGESVLVINLLGHDAQKVPSSDYFKAASKALKENRKKVSAILVDLHAISGGENQSLSWFLDGKVSAVIGTHSHVPTADTRILPKGTAMQADVGMCGAYDTVIGIQPNRGIAAFKILVGENVPRPPTQPQKPPYFCDAVLIETDGPRKAKSIKRLTSRPQ